MRSGAGFSALHSCHLRFRAVGDPLDHSRWTHADCGEYRRCVSTQISAQSVALTVESDINGLHFMEVAHEVGPGACYARGVEPDKAHAVLELGALLGCAPAEIAAIGDGENDVAMLGAVGLGVAVANARPAVRAAAAWLTASNDEDGVAVALQRMRRERLI